MKVRFFNIVWDTDGESVDLPVSVVRDVPDETDFNEEAADLLSDEFGWCVSSVEFEVLDGPAPKGRRIKISYDVVTPESAEIGDFAENGWENEEGECADPDELDVEEHGSELAAVIALAVEIIGNGVEASDYPTCCPGHTWYTEIDGETDYSDGSEKRLSYHLEGFSEEEELGIYAALIG